MNRHWTESDRSDNTVQVSFGGLSQNKLVCVFMIMQCNVWLTDVFLIIFGQQWSSIAQRKQIHQALIHTHTWEEGIFVGLGLHMGLVDNKKDTELFNVSVFDCIYSSLIYLAMTV